VVANLPTWAFVNLIVLDVLAALIVLGLARRFLP
jgi:hypothetical protein